MATILVIDDDPAIRLMFSRALGTIAAVDQASGGAEGLRMLGAQRYDLVLLDLHMPLVDGFHVLQTIGSRPGPNIDTPVYVVTADTSEQARLQALRKRGALFFLSKPVNLQTLLALAGAAIKKADKKPAAAASKSKPSTAQKPGGSGSSGST